MQRNQKLTVTFGACKSYFYINCLIPRALIGSFLSSIGVQTDKSSAVNFDNVMMKFIINKRTDA